MFCKYCGKSIVAENGRCKYCGHELDKLEDKNDDYSFEFEENNDNSQLEILINNLGKSNSKKVDEAVNVLNKKIKRINKKVKILFGVVIVNLVLVIALLISTMFSDLDSDKDLDKTHSGEISNMTNDYGNNEEKTTMPVNTGGQIYKEKNKINKNSKKIID